MFVCGAKFINNCIRFIKKINSFRSKLEHLVDRNVLPNIIKFSELRRNLALLLNMLANIFPIQILQMLALVRKYILSTMDQDHILKHLVNSHYIIN